MENKIGQLFLKFTNYTKAPISDQSRGLPQPPYEFEVPSKVKRINLPEPSTITVSPIDVRQAIEQRTSRRDYTDSPLTLSELAYLLWCTQGVKGISNRPATLRTVPSASSRHAFETFLLINRVVNLKPSLYRYLAMSHQLISMPTSQDIHKKINEACLSQSHIENSAITFIWVAVLERMTWRHPVRGYRYLFIDAGHVCQNLYLAAEQISCGVCAIGAFDDDLVNNALQIDGRDLFTIYIASLGRLI